ncbi:MAG: rod-binding protein [Pseudomonadota bacterium]
MNAEFASIKNAMQISNDNNHSDRKAQIQRAAKMFEGLFVRELFKVMRSSEEEEGLFENGTAKGIYTEMFDGAMADKISEAGGLGISDILVHQLSGGGGSRDSIVRGTHIDQALRITKTTQSPSMHAIASMRRMAQQQDLGGIAFETPDRANPIDLQDPQEYLRWPVEGSSDWLDDSGWIKAEKQASVLAAASGQVIRTGSNYLVMDHGKGLRTTYRNLGDVSAQAGDLVLRGQVLGQVGPRDQIQFGAQRYGQSLELAKIAKDLVTEK